MPLFTFNVFHQRVLDREILRALHALQRSGELQMASLQEALDAVRAQTTVVASIKAFVAGLEDQIKAITAGKLSAEDQAKVDEIFATVNSDNTDLTGIVVAGTTSEPVVASETPPAPPVESAPAAPAAP